MNVNLEKDQKCSIDVQLCSSVLRQLCTTIEFKVLPVRTLDQRSSDWIDFPGEINRIQRRLGQHPADLHFFLTRRPFEDNYFAHRSDNIVVVSFAHWEDYTSLPEENGLLHYIARYIALSLQSVSRHPNRTGCVFDFHGIKSGIDLSMREGKVCSDCHKSLWTAVARSPNKKNVYRDVTAILDAVGNTSRLGRSIYTVLEDRRAGSLNWQTFESLVADYYRSIGAKVEQDCNIAGFQIDLLVIETTGSGRTVRTIVECKFHKGKVGNRVINDFGRIFATIREGNLADAAALVSYSGFTQHARVAADHIGMTLTDYHDVVQRMEEQGTTQVATKRDARTVGTENKDQHRAFVVMPFAPDLDDLYFLGIQSAVKDCRGVCVRMDQQEFNGAIVEEIYANIIRADVIIAVISKANLNVYYEIGYAHALRREVILLAHDIKETPFDLGGFNHIVYTSIRDLHEKLRRRVGALWSGRTHQ